jgi:hypothetical protein
MITWDFWVDYWEHPFSSWFRAQSVPAFIEPLPIEIVPPKAGPEDPQPVVTPVRVFTAYELAVIGYYNRFGYVDVKADRAIIEDYHESRREDYSRNPEYADYPDAVNPFTEDYYYAPYAMRIGRWTDETIPQIVRYL